MANIKKKLTAAQKQAKREAKAQRQKKYTWVFMGGKQVRIKRPAMIEGVPVAQYVSENADPIWLHQNGMYEEIGAAENDEDNVFL